MFNGQTARVISAAAVTCAAPAHWQPSSTKPLASSAGAGCTSAGPAAWPPSPPPNRRFYDRQPTNAVLLTASAPWPQVVGDSDSPVISADIPAADGQVSYPALTVNSNGQVTTGPLAVLAAVAPNVTTPALTVIGLAGVNAVEVKVNRTASPALTVSSNNTLLLGPTSTYGNIQVTGNLAVQGPSTTLKGLSASTAALGSLAVTGKTALGSNDNDVDGCVWLQPGSRLRSCITGCDKGQRSASLGTCLLSRTTCVTPAVLPSFRNPVLTVRGVTQFRGLVKNTRGFRAQGSIEANSAVVVFGLQGESSLQLCVLHCSWTPRA